MKLVNTRFMDTEKFITTDFSVVRPSFRIRSSKIFYYKLGKPLTYKMYFVLKANRSW